MYDFDAGDLSLDFANTKNWHASASPEEFLKTYNDLLAWGEQAGLVSPEAVRWLNQLAVERPEESGSAYDLAIQLREAIYRIFSNRYASEPISPMDLAIVNSVVRDAMAHRQLIISQDSIHWEWVAGIDDTNLILWPVAYAAAQLLTSDKITRVRECEDDRGCGYLFIDQTKNHSRRWCSMDSCGNRAKARRHYSRLQTN